MIGVIKTASGNYNLLGTDKGSFILQGNLTEEQLRELVEAAQAELKTK